MARKMKTPAWDKASALTKDKARDAVKAKYAKKKTTTKTATPKKVLFLIRIS